MAAAGTYTANYEQLREEARAYYRLIAEARELGIPTDARTPMTVAGMQAAVDEAHARIAADGSDGNPFEVVVMHGSRVLARADAADAASILRAGQVLHDEALPTTQTVGKLSVIFLANGVHVRTVEGRPS